MVLAPVVVVVDEVSVVVMLVDTVEASSVSAETRVPPSSGTSISLNVSMIDYRIVCEY